MTDKELLTQFDAMCKEWFGKYGYSEKRSPNNDDDNTRSYYYIDRVGLNNWDVPFPDDDITDEDGKMHQITLCYPVNDNKDFLYIHLHDTQTCHNDALFWNVMHLVDKYFEVRYNAIHSDIDKNVYEFEIIGVTKP